MELSLLKQLLGQEESAKLDFKIKLHDIYNSDAKVREAHWSELLKDIIALCNGNVGTATQSAYLVIGAADELNQSSVRDLLDVGAIELTRKQLLDRVNSACSPHIPDILCEVVEVNSVRLFVVTIPPTPYVHRTTKTLKTPKNSFPPNSFLFRRKDGESTYNAAPEEQDALQREKRAAIPENHRAGRHKEGNTPVEIHEAALCQPLIRWVRTSFIETLRFLALLTPQFERGMRSLQDKVTASGIPANSPAAADAIGALLFGEQIATDVRLGAQGDILARTRAKSAARDLGNALASELLKDSAPVTGESLWDQANETAGHIPSSQEELDVALPLIRLVYRRYAGSEGRYVYRAKMPVVLADEWSAAWEHRSTIFDQNLTKLRVLLARTVQFPGDVSMADDSVGQRKQSRRTANALDHIYRYWISSEVERELMLRRVGAT